jgi:phosphohistidine phosphatase SixA
MRLVAALPLAAGLLPSPAAADLAPARELLAAGGAVVYFRHGATTWSGVDNIAWPRERQRLLSELGIEQSKRIGAAFRDNGFPVGEVIASPFARCRDMAEIAFGRVEERMELLGLLSDSDGVADRVDYLRGKLSKPPTGGNRIVIAHRSNISHVAGVSLGEGDAVVMRPTGDGFERLATLAPSDW